MQNIIREVSVVISCVSYRKFSITFNTTLKEAFSVKLQRQDFYLEWVKVVFYVGILLIIIINMYFF